MEGHSDIDAYMGDHMEKDLFLCKRAIDSAFLHYKGSQKVDFFEKKKTV